MKYPNFIKSVSIIAAILVYSNNTQAQIVSCNAFLQGNYVEVGINTNGAFGSSVNAPTGYHPRGSGGTLYNSCGATCTVTEELGFVADPNRTGWNPSVTGTGYFGDYFVPGTPEEGWAIESNGHESNAFNQNDVCPTDEPFTGGMTGSIVSYTSGATVSSTWVGMNADGLQITQVTSLDTANVFFTMHVTLKNTTAATVNNVYYLRTVDPDNDETLTGPPVGGFPTVNTIVYQLPNPLGATLVSATGVTYTNVWLGLGTLDCRARCFYISSTGATLAPTVSLDTLYNELSTTADYSGTLVQDVGIGLVFSLGNIPAGDSVTLSYAYVLKQSDLLAALNSTVSAWTATGDTATAILSKDTAYVCENRLDTVTLTDTGTTSWSWISLTGETLSTYTGTRTTVSVNTTPVRLLAIGLGSGCAGANDTVYMTLFPRVLSVTATSNSPVCVGSPINFTGSSGGSGTHYLWTGPAGYTSTSENPTIASAVAGDAGTYRFSEVYDGCVSDTAAIAITVGTVTLAAISPAGSTICPGNHDTLRDATTGGVWTVSNTSIATVSGGVVTTIATGVDTVTYSIGGCKAIATVTVNTAMAAITPSSATLCGTSTETLIDATTGGAWTSSNTAVAIVSGGVVSPEGAGVDTIRYSAGGCVATATVTVNSVYAIAPLAPVVCMGSTALLTDASTGGSWSSGNTAVATISSSGTVTPVSVGTATISYAFGGCYATEVVTVSTAPAAITPSTAVGICVGGTTTLADATSGGTWGSSITTIATVTSGGQVTGITTGTATITYSDGGCYATKTVTVGVSSSISPTSLNICTNTTGALIGSPTGGTWSSGTTTIATVNSGGTVYGDGPGVDTVYYTLGTTCPATVIVTVTIPPAAITPASPVTICLGDTVALHDATSGGTWTSSNTSAATVSATGTVYSISGTGVDIYYSILGCTALEDIVFSAGVAAISPLASPICSGTTASLTDATTGGAWSSSATGIATVTSGGIVSGVAAGTATIDYTVGICSASIVVTVSTAPGPIIPPGSVTLCVGTTAILADATTGGSWVNGTTSIATINPATGVITGVSPGTTSVLYAIGTCISIESVTVTPGVSPISPSSPTICIGSTLSLIDATTGGAWSSGATGVATVTSGGIVSGVATGTAAIVYTAGSCSASTIVTVTAAPVITGNLTACTGALDTLHDAISGGIWSSGNISVGAIGATTGILTGTTAGTTTITDSTSPGCKVSAIVTVNPTPTISFTGAPAIICAGSSGGTGVVIPASTGTWSSSNTSVITVGSGGGITGVSSGTSVITYTTTGGCNATATLTVVASSAISPVSAVCAGGTETVTDATSGGVWSISNTALATVSASGVVSGISTGTDIITYEIPYTVGAVPFSCTYTATVNITSGAGSITPSTAVSFCSGTTTSLADAITGGVWSSSNSGLASVSTSGVVSGYAASTVTITYTAGSCYTTKTLTINQGPAAILPALSTVCTGTTMSLTDAVSGGIWASSTTGTATVTSGGVISGVAIGTSTISYTLGSCTVTDIVNVAGTPSVITPSAPVIFCSASTTTLVESVTGGTWTSGSTGIATVTEGGIVTGVAAGTATISYNSGSCYITKTVTVSPGPAAILPASPTICTGNTLSLTDAVSGGSWSSSATGTATVGSTGTVGGVAAGTVNIQYTIGSCVATNVVTVVTAPTVGPIGGTTSLCVGTSITLTEAATVGLWSSTNTTVATVSAAGTVYGAGVGTATISYTISSGCGVIGAAHVVTVNTTPSAGTITGSAIMCAGTTMSLSNTVLDGSWSSSNGFASVNSATGLVTGISTGTDTITYTVTTPCGTTSTTKVISIGAYLTAGTISGSAILCGGSTVHLTDLVTGGTWSSSNTSATVGSTGIVTGAPEGGMDTISYTVTAGCGSAVSTDIIDVYPTAISGTMTGVSTLCVGSSATFTESVGSGVWSARNSNAVVTGGGLVMGMTAGTDVISYTVTNSCGTSVATLNVTIGGTVSAGTISGAGSVCAGTPVTLTDGISGGVWSSSNTNSTVSSAGLVSAIARGLDTILYTVTTSCGTATATFVISANSTALTAGTITGATGVCVGYPLSLSDAISGGVWSISNARATITSAGLVSGVTTGMDTVTYTVSGSCGTATTSQVITIGTSSAGAGSITGTTVVCAGSTILLADAVSGGAWSSSNTNASVAGGIVSGVAAGTATISYSITYSCGVAYAIKNITINPSAGSNIIAGGSTVCLGSTIILTDGVSGGIWSSDNTNVSVSSGVVTGIALGTSTVLYSVSGSCGTSTATSVITVVSGTAVTVGPISSLSIVCVGSGITLVDPTTGGVWAASNGHAIVVGAGIIDGVSPGIDTISYTVSGLCGSAEAIKVLNVDTIPIVAPISGPTTQCIGTTISLSDPDGGGVWTTSTSAVGTVTVFTGVVTGVSAGTTTITYTVTNLYGCPGTVILTDAVTPTTVTTDITGSAGVCVGSAVTLSNATSGGAWSSSNTVAAVIDPVTGSLTGVTPGTTTISYTVTNSCGTSTVTSIETVSSVPTVSTIGGSPTGCIGSSVTLTDATAGGVWSSSNTTIATVNSTSGAVTGITSSLVTIYYTVTSASGCSLTVNASLFINPAPVIDAITGIASECAGSSTNLSDGTGGGVWSSSNTAVATVNTSGNVTGITPGTATISYITTGSGCPGVASVIDVVNTVPISAPVTGVLHVCAGASTGLGNIITGGVWSSSNTGIAVIDATRGVVTGLSGGTDEIHYSVSNSCGFAMDSATITVYLGPAIDPISAAYTALCTGDLLDVSDAITGGIWVTSNTTIATVSSAGIITGVSIGIDTIYYVVTNSHGCSASAMLSITIGGSISSAVVEPVGVVELCKGHSEYMHVVSSGGGSYQWLRNTSAIAGATANSYTTSAIGNYAVVVSNGICSETVAGPSVILAPVPVITFTAPDILYTGVFTSYKWFRNGVLIAGGTGSTLNENGGGVYMVVVTDANGCSDTSIGYTVTGTGVNSVNGQENIRVYPNPATSMIHIDAPVEVNVSVLSIDGKVLIEQKDATDVDISNLADAMYLVLVYDQSGLLLKTTKFAKLE